MSTDSGLAKRLGTQAERSTAFDLVQGMRGELAKALPAQLNIDTFLRLALTELRTNADLANCSAMSLLGALMTAARLGLEPGGPLGQFYLTPRTLKDQGRVVVPIIGYQGLRDLAYRSGLVKSLHAVLVREGDSISQGANEQRGHWVEWSPLDSDSKRPVIGVLGIGGLMTGAYVFRHLDLAQIEARKNRGAAGNRGPWGTDYEAMVLKTGIRSVAPDLPKSAAFALAVKVDEQVQNYRADDPAWQPEPVADEVTEDVAAQ